MDLRFQIGVGLGDLHDAINIVHPLLLSGERHLPIRPLPICYASPCAISSTIPKSSIMPLPVM